MVGRKFKTASTCSSSSSVNLLLGAAAGVMVGGATSTTLRRRSWVALASPVRAAATRVDVPMPTSSS
jgi:hypothetical protein